MRIRSLAIAGAVLLGHAAAAGGEEGKPMLRLSDRVGERVECAGRKSRIPWQHLVGHVEGKTPEYFDPEDGGSQLVVHVRDGLPDDAACVLWGRVLEVRGAPKRPKAPGDKDAKADETYVEYALDVDRVVRVPAPAEVPALVERLVDPALSRADREEVEARVVAAGLAAVPRLLERLGDPRGAAASPGGRAEAMLYRIVEPRNHRPPRGGATRPGPSDPAGAMLRVKDWKAFFARRQGQGLAEIRAALEPAVDRWYRSGGETQVVD